MRVNDKMSKRSPLAGAAGNSVKRRIWKRIQRALISTFVVSAAFVLAQFPSPPPHGSHTSPDTCSMPGLMQSAGHQLKAHELLDSYNSQASLVHSLEASAIVRVQGGSKYAAKLKDSRPAPVELRFIAPAWLRMTGMVPFSARRPFDMWSDGRDFRLLAPEGKVMRFIVGPVDAPTTSADFRENVRPQAVLEALHWLPAKLENANESPFMKSNETEAIHVELSGPAAAAREKATLEFDLRSGTLSQLEILDEASKVITAIMYSDWQRVPATLGGDGAICFPKRMLVDQRQQDLQVELKMLSMQVNPQLSPLQLQLFPPRGIPVTRIPASAH